MVEGNNLVIFLKILRKPFLDILVNCFTVNCVISNTWLKSLKKMTYSALAASTPSTSPIYSRLEIRTSGSIPSSRRLLITAFNLGQKLAERTL